jgi:hypothetical protein
MCNVTAVVLNKLPPADVKGPHFIVGVRRKLKIPKRETLSYYEK